MKKQHLIKITRYLFIHGMLASIFFMFAITSLKVEERLAHAIFTGKKIIFTCIHQNFNPPKNFARLNLQFFVTDRKTFSVLNLFRAHFGTPDQDADFAGRGLVNFANLSIFHNLFILLPGSSGLPPSEPDPTLNNGLVFYNAI